MTKRMTFKSFFSVVTVFATSLGMTYAAPEYIGWWSTGRPTQIVIDASTITQEGGGEAAQVLRYSDITPAGSDGYRLEVTTTIEEPFFAKFIAISTSTDADGDSMSVKSYNSSEDLELGRDEQSVETYYRDPAPTESAEGTGEAVSGTLQVGKNESVILYFGEDSRDYAAWCFKNDSAVGRRILETCAEGQDVQITGTIDHEAACTVPGLEADLSASGRITSVEEVSLMGG